jgi:hypothetical protein
LKPQGVSHAVGQLLSRANDGTLDLISSTFSHYLSLLCQIGIDLTSPPPVT